MRLGIVSDVHCDHAALRTAATRLVAAGVDEILLAGDAHFEYRFSNETVDVICEFGIRCVAGNHDARVLANKRACATAGADRLEFMSAVPNRLVTKVGGRTLTMVHANPWAPTYDYLYPGNPAFARCDELDTDYLVLGHTHVPMIEQIGRTLVINPGSLTMSRESQALTYAVLDTASGEAAIVR